MGKEQLTLVVLDLALGICRLSADDKVPEWVNEIDDFVSITRTNEELSIVCPEKFIPANIKVEFGWKALKVKDQLDFNLTGILSSIANPLAKNSISIFAISTYDTDYVLVQEDNFNETVKILSDKFNIK